MPERSVCDSCELFIGIDMFFSVAIPTRNRPSLVEHAIRSVVTQTFQDKEIVVVDNSDAGDSEKVWDICQKYPEVRYVRTGNLPMHENWNTAIQESKGEYVCILSDRLRWRYRTLLDRVSRVIERTHAESVSWKWIREPKKGQLVPQGSGLIGLYQSDDLLRAFCEMDWGAFTFMSPRGLNAAISREVLTGVRDRIGCFCMPDCPDYTLAYTVLLATGACVHMDSYEIISGGLSVSAGERSATDVTLGLQVFISNHGSLFEGLKYVPIKTVTTKNVVVSDFFRVLDAYGLNKRFRNIDVHGYFRWIREDIGMLKNSTGHAERVKEFNRAAKFYDVAAISL